MQKESLFHLKEAPSAQANSVGMVGDREGRGKTQERKLEEERLK